MQEAKPSSALENFFTIDVDVYQAFSEEKEEPYELFILNLLNNYNTLPEPALQ